jgi:hypothetical protein
MKVLKTSDAARTANLKPTADFAVGRAAPKTEICNRFV